MRNNHFKSQFHLKMMRNTFLQKYFSYNNLLITGELQQNYENMRNDFFSSLGASTEFLNSAKADLTGFAVMSRKPHKDLGQPSLLPLQLHKVKLRCIGISLISITRKLPATSSLCTERIETIPIQSACSIKV